MRCCSMYRMLTLRTEGIPPPPTLAPAVGIAPKVDAPDELDIAATASGLRQSNGRTNLSQDSYG